jgi:excisionase family DNA binding protein
MSDVRRNLIPIKTALERGHFKRTKAYRLIAEGKIIAYRDGQRTLVDADSLDAYQASLPRVGPNNAG